MDNPKVDGSEQTLNEITEYSEEFGNMILTESTKGVEEVDADAFLVMLEKMIMEADDDHT